jgi:hypothetical protein
MTKFVSLPALLAGLVLIAGCALPWDRVERLNVKLNRTSSSGLEINLAPRDSRGNLIRLTGSLTVKLWVYDNPRGCGFTEGEFRQEWTDINLRESSYDKEGAEVDLPFKGFFPDVMTIGGLDVVLIENGRSISGGEDRIDIGTQSFT